MLKQSSKITHTRQLHVSPMNLSPATGTFINQRIRTMWRQSWLTVPPTSASCVWGGGGGVELSSAPYHHDCTHPSPTCRPPPPPPPTPQALPLQHHRHFYQPENQDDVEAIVADCTVHKRKLRVVGSGLSPNGVGFSGDGMMSMALLDKILWVDPAQQLVRLLFCG